MSDDGLGLIVDDCQHIETINGFDAVPVSFRVKDLSSVVDWESPIEVMNQGQTNSCAGHAGAANFSHRQYVETGEVVKYSPWFSYITSQRASRQFIGRDGGTSIKSVIDAATLDGCCLESMCLRPSRYTTALASEAVRDAAAHKHVGGVVDLRDWTTCLDFLTDRRSVVIGTRWYSTQANVRDIETKALGSSGSFRGYHARALIGWATIGGVVSPRVLNSHGDGWGTNGRATIERELWEWWKRDANFFALGFTDINERIPKRRDWTGFQWTSGATPDWVGGQA